MDHPFSQYIRALGKGPKMWRDLTFEEAEGAMTLILTGDVDRLQVGAFLMLLRRKGETAEELAGMAAAVRADAGCRTAPGIADYDWPSYADRHRQQPWFILAAILLADQGHKILMHGIEGYADGLAPTRPGLRLFGIPQADGLDHAEALLEKDNLVYVGLETFSPRLQALFDLRPLLGLRTAVNTFARDLNPLHAPCQLQGVFHPPYKAAHLQTARLLGQRNAMVFKGGGGEVMRNPMKPALVDALVDGQETVLEWPALTADKGYKWRDEDLHPAQLVRMWRGELDLPVPELGIVGTLSVALKMKRSDWSLQQADEQALALWQGRDRNRFSL
ncbi:glycosyl transferase family protein [Sneathiella chinensis]|uniref:Glycosyl transferase family 3 N-terminal domain-containing protein n=1 Tax=Sneathiella chinensis TaxID=349750 RepID=A0ABQ5U0E4_9PROT|nr:glycosyl transferase family protein [Sneathiella chinensis]GLQ05288.1 hypothetical protein GCM10007924_05090 [Sneathiella chinensis]